MRQAAYLFLLGSTLGWISSSIALGFSGLVNIGTLLPGVILAVLWIAFAASGIEARSDATPQSGAAEGESPPGRPSDTTPIHTKRGKA